MDTCSFRFVGRGLSGLLVAALLLLGQAWAAAAEAVDGYQLATGDKVRVTVYGEDDLTLETRISDRGTISYPLIGVLKVTGLTISGLEDLITRELKPDYLVNPRVSVSILEYRRIFVNGQVKSPGAFPYQPGMTVRHAISIAGGFTERASRSKINIVRGSNSQRVRESDSVRPGDTVTVEESFF